MYFIKLIVYNDLIFLIIDLIIVLNLQFVLIIILFQESIIYSIVLKDYKYTFNSYSILVYFRLVTYCFLIYSFKL